MRKTVYLPNYVQKGISSLKRGFPNQPINIIVFDTETYSAKSGEAYLLTLYNGREITMKWINENDLIEYDVTTNLYDKDNKIVETRKETAKATKILRVFAKYLEQNCKERQLNLVFAHNLEFDLGAVLSKLIVNAYSPHKISGDFITEGFKINVCTHKRYWGRITFSKNKSALILDTYNFFTFPLEKLSTLLNLRHKKPERPDLIKKGLRPRNEKERKIVLEYVKSEILATYDLAKYIVSLWNKYDVPASVSIADFGAKVFKRHFLNGLSLPQISKLYHVYFTKNGRIVSIDNIENMKYDKHFYLVKDSPIYMAEKSIHGGRASSFIGKVRLIEDVNYYDFNSMYPWALSMLPPLTSGKWVYVTRFFDKYEGFYKVSGYAKECKYPIILPYDNNMTFADGQKFVDAYLTSYEIREALRMKELTIMKIEGWIWKPKWNAVNPFKKYVEHFFKLKDENKISNYAWYWTYKTILNSLYGKTYQTVPLIGEPIYDAVYIKELDECVPVDKKWKAGNLYLPHVGSWVTSFCRAKLHEYMHRHNALTCSTDSFMTLENVKVGDKLGELKLVHRNCYLLFVRPKLYVLFNNEINETIKNKQFTLQEILGNVPDSEMSFLRKYIVKYALHGFRGTLEDLLRLYRDKKNLYEYTHFWKMKESIRRKQPEKMRVTEKRKAKLNIEWKKEVMPCGYPLEFARNKEMCIYPNCFQCAYVGE